MKKIIVSMFFLASIASSSSALSNDSSVEECKFTSVPHAVCSISMYRLIAAPEKFDSKYISVVGYLGIDNGRLSMFPSKESYILGISQESFSVSSDYPRRMELSQRFKGNTVRIVGRFTYKILGDRPGLGYVRDVVNIYRVTPREFRQEDQDIGGTAEEVSRWAKLRDKQGTEKPGSE